MSVRHLYILYSKQSQKFPPKEIGIFSTKLDRFIRKTTRIFIFIYGLFTEAVTG
jgi:hypothetical protein